MNKSTSSILTVSIALTQILMLSACGKFSPAEVAAATAKLEAKTETKAYTTTPDTKKAAADVTHKEVVTCKTTATEVFTPTGGEPQTNTSTAEIKMNRVVTVSADGKTTSVESTGVYVISGGFHMEGDQKVTNVQRGTKVSTVTRIRTENADGTTTEVVTSKGKRTADQGSYIQTPSGSVQEKEFEDNFTAIFKVVGNETRGISIQRGDAAPEADASVTTKTEKDGVITEVDKTPATTVKGEDGDTTTSEETTCVTELVK